MMILPSRTAVSCVLSCAQGLQGALKNASFTRSPVATLEDLCTTHERRYVQRYFDGLFTDVSRPPRVRVTTRKGERGGEGRGEAMERCVARQNSKLSRRVVAPVVGSKTCRRRRFPRTLGFPAVLEKVPSGMWLEKEKAKQHGESPRLH